jgi:uncharacterized protein
MAAQLIRAEAYRRMPWKNGGGETIEIAIAPEGATVESFDWRISLARVDAPGPFSLFPGVDRTLAVVEGPALALRFETGRTVTLTAGSEPLAFPADIPVSAEIPQGGITDLNVMTRRGHMRHSLRRQSVAGHMVLSSSCDAMLLLVHDAACRVRSSGIGFAVAPGDAVLCRRELDTLRVEVVSESAAQLSIVELWRS